MKRLFAVAFTFALATTLPAADAPAFITNSIHIAGQPNLIMVVPKGWTFKTNDAIPPMIEAHSAKEEVVLQLTVMWDQLATRARRPTSEEMSGIITKVADIQYVPNSVEKKTVLEEFKGPEITGTLARFTDQQWVGKAPPAGEFPNVATGMFTCSTFWGHLTLLTQDKDGPSFKQGMDALKSLHKAKR